MKEISIRTIAAAAGVSAATVSRALAGSTLVSAATRKRVIAAARKFGYWPNVCDSGWSVGVIVEMKPCSINGYYANILAALSSEIFARGCRVELVLCDDLDSFDERVVRGAIDITTHADIPGRWQKGFTLPLVRVNGSSQRLGQIGSVRSDCVEVTRRAVELLWRNGHREIGFLSMEGLEREAEKVSGRWHGFLEALTQLGVHEPERYGFFPSRRNGVGIEQLLLQVRQRGVTALICPNEHLALRLEPELRKLALRVPEDLSLVEWECPGVSDCLVPPRTTIRPDYNRLAFEAMEMLTAMVRERSTPPDVVLPTELIVRESIFDRRAYDGAYVGGHFLTPGQRRIVAKLQGGEASVIQLAVSLGLSERSGGFRRNLRQLREWGVIAFTLSEHPRSPRQKLRLKS